MTGDRGETTTPYTSSAKPAPRESADQLRARIPGWGVDLNPHDRPSVPRLQVQRTLDEHFPTRQPELQPRERSIEHATLTPVFGTSCPTHGVSGVIRRYSYRRFSEGRAAHWLLLIAADRVDSTGSTFRSFVSRRPDNVITETGILSEFSRHGLRSRVGQGRSDVKHQWMDPLIVLFPWAIRIAGVTVAVKTLRRKIRR